MLQAQEIAAEEQEAKQAGEHSGVPERSQRIGPEAMAGFSA